MKLEMNLASGHFDSLSIESPVPFEKGFIIVSKPSTPIMTKELRVSGRKPWFYVEKGGWS